MSFKNISKVHVYYLKGPTKILMGRLALQVCFFPFYFPRRGVPR